MNPVDAARESIRTGDYSGTFRHSEAAQRFVIDVLLGITPRAPNRPDFRILECGCGTGAWLQLAASLFVGSPGLQVFGFDLTPEMIELARRRLLTLTLPESLQVGNALDDQAYAFNQGRTRAFDIIFAYDLVQQLPRNRQKEACEVMIRHLAPGGAIAVFDHERFSAHGLKMGIAKFLTRWFKVPILPRYYSAAHYPALGILARRIASGGRSVEIRRAADIPRRALLIR